MAIEKIRSKSDRPNDFREERNKREREKRERRVRRDRTKMKYDFEEVIS